ncbi:hypothetical protein MSKU15_1462 [Komagataeibacter diospyri]|uniref:hypothetical protein n=1 Tax=Komagataeibacter diospyri TaxID=1932662 RepID=UPI00113E74B5|nr:hypothetical protein [Komagataeibacter diospyri]GCE89861.1 hypothetical protein MSKU15_1462 [Komagataeibacter diospyri]
MIKCKLLIRKFSILLIFALSFFYVLTFFLSPFTDWDSTFYPLIGKGIFRYHILPYDYIFDHKPYLVYVFYYIWTQVEPILNGRFAILAMVSMVSVAFMFSSAYRTDKWQTLFYLSIGGVIGDYLGGNTEVLQIPLELSVILMLCKGVQEHKIPLFFLAGIVSAIAVNINYLAGCVLSPIILYLFLGRVCTVVEFLACVAGGMIGLTGIFLPFLIAGHGKLAAYFDMQHHFLQHYGGASDERMYTFALVALYIVPLCPMLVLWFGRRDVCWGNLRERLLSLWFVFSVVAAILSGHGFYHYFSLFLIPGMLICLLVHRDAGGALSWRMMPLYLYAAFLMVSGIVSNINDMKRAQLTDPARVSQIVGHQKVLNINSDHSLYYLSDMETFDPILFCGQIEIYFGPQAADHYLDDLRQRPPFVLMPHAGCINHTVAPQVCSWVKDHYHPVYEAYKGKDPNRNNARYYNLYKIN